MDNLEAFIRENRSAFDAEQPHLRVWRGLEKRLDEHAAAAPPQEAGPDVETVATPRLVALNTRRRTTYRVLSMAALALVLIFAGGVIGANFFAPSVEPLESLAEISPEYGEMEQYFRQQIDERAAQLASYEVDPVVQQDLAQLDSVYRELALEIKKAPEAARAQVVAAMIENYRTKVDLLEHILDRMQTIQPETNDNDEIKI